MQLHIIRFEIPEYQDHCNMYVTTQPTEEQHKSYDQYMKGYMEGERATVAKYGIDTSNPEYRDEFFAELNMVLENMLVEEGFELIEWETITTVIPAEE